MSYPLHTVGSSNFYVFPDAEAVSARLCVKLSAKKEHPMIELAVSNLAEQIFDESSLDTLVASYTAVLSPKTEDHPKLHKFLFEAVSSCATPRTSSISRYVY